MKTSTVKLYIAEVARRARAVDAPDPLPTPSPEDDPRARLLTLAADHADIGTVVADGTRLRFLKRVLVRLTRHVTHHQVVFNHAVVDALATPAPMPEAPPLEAKVLAILAAIDVQVARLQEQVRTLQTENRELRAACPGSSPSGARFDDLYIAFEERFRGSHEWITELMEPYVDEITAVAGAVGGRVLDLGPGRGELLELLRAQRVDAYGVDVNEASARNALDRGLDVVVGDALAHLQSLPDESLAAVTGMHIVEHVPAATLLEMVDEILRVLRPGGRIILESPNPTTWQVGANTFHLDPTHLRPVHPLFLEFLLSHRGFVDVEIRLLHAFDDDRIGPPGEAVDPVVAEAIARFDDLRVGPHDYVAVGTRPQP